MRSPHAGRFWHRPIPDGAAAFCRAVGSELEAGHTVGLIEVMKTFTHLRYGATGELPERAKVVRFVAEDGAEVAEGEALIEIEPV